MRVGVFNGHSSAIQVAGVIFPARKHTEVDVDDERLEQLRASRYLSIQYPLEVGEPGPKHPDDMTAAELRELATQLGVEVPVRARKPEIRAAIEDSFQQDAAEQVALAEEGLAASAPAPPWQPEERWAEPGEVLPEVPEEAYPEGAEPLEAEIDPEEL